MSGNYTRWYRDGTITIENGSTTVTGKNTNWNTAGLKPGDILSTTNANQLEIDTIIDDTHLTLKEAFPYDTIRNHNYYIIRNFNASFGAQAAAQATALCADVKRYIDGKQETLRGKTAYEVALDEGFVGSQSDWVASLNGDTAYIIAKKNGFKGTEQEWLESLKADNEWSTLNARTQILTKGSIKNALYNPVSLGNTFTDVQKAAIANGTFENLYLGSYWSININAQDVYEAWNDTEEVKLSTLSSYTGNVQLFIIDFNYYKTITYVKYQWGIFGDKQNYDLNAHNASCCSKPHLLMLMTGDNPVLNMRLTFDTTGPYYNLLHRKFWNNYVIPKLKTVLGADHIAPFPCQMGNAVNSNGIHTGFKAEYTYMELPSEMMLFGSYVSGYDKWSFDERRASIFNFASPVDLLYNHWRAISRTKAGNNTYYGYTKSTTTYTGINLYEGTYPIFTIV